MVAWNPVTHWLALAACAASPGAPSERPEARVQAAPPRAIDAGGPSTAAPALDPDGDDDPIATGPGPLPDGGHFERVGRPPLALRRICDLTPLGDSLYLAHAVQPLGQDGATLTRWDGERFRVAFDWNRAGEPRRGGGGGQGFLRVHAIGGRLYVPDADPPYAGFRIADRGTEGFVFVSDLEGRFAPSRAPHHRPPDVPTETRPGAGVLPRAYHVIDAIRFRDRLYASTGSVPPSERAWRGASPGALHVASPDLSRWTYEVDYPHPWQNGVWRLTFLVRFRGHLYAGIQDYDGREPNDYVVFGPPADRQSITQADVHAARATSHGGALTIRWWADAGKLYWIAWERDDGIRLRVTDDGNSWRPIDLPEGAGWPTDLTRFKGEIVLLAEHGLYRLDGDRVAQIAAVPEARSPFVLDDPFCAAPLAVYRGELFAGSQRDGSLWRLTGN
jgi:hypothetical protein